MDINIDNLTTEQLSYVNAYKRINVRLETLQKQMTIIQYEAQGLIEELEDLRKKENKKLNDGKK
jgi:septation ring formation regulator EzrA